MPSLKESLSQSSSHPSSSSIHFQTDLEFPFGKLDGLDQDDLRNTAYEIFFTSCRSSPGFGGGRNALSYYSATTTTQDTGGGDGIGNYNSNGGGSGSGSRQGLLMGTSRLKRMLGLRTTKKLSSPSSRRSYSIGGGGGGGSNSNSNPDSPRSICSSPGRPGFGFGFSNTAPPGMRLRRPMTSAEIMRQQMKVSEQSDNRLRKTLMRTLVGQMGRRAETIILPLELLRHLKPSEFDIPPEYHIWQKRQLKILEAGLVIHPNIPLDRSNIHAMQLRDVVRGSEIKSIDTSKNSETMRKLCNRVVSLSWRSNNGGPSDVCHWADGYPLNIHLYLALLHSIFDMRDETLVLDEVDELLELMKKTWSTLGINKLIHNVCFTWILFQQYVITEQTEPDLLSASLAMLSEVSNDVKRADREVIYFKVLSAALNSMQGWLERRLIDYHESFPKGATGLMENILSMALSTVKILEEDVSNLGVMQDRMDTEEDTAGNRVDYYIRSSLKIAFTKMLENGANNENTQVEDDTSQALIKLAKETEELAMREKELFSLVLKRWHPIAAGVAAMTLHSCYGVVLKRYLAGVPTLTNEMVKVLQGAGKLEKLLVQMVVEDSNDCEDGGKAMVREMVPYEVDSIISGLLKNWINERLKKGKEYLNRAKETENWNPRSKLQPYVHSAVLISNFAKETVEDFFDIPIAISDDLVQDLADGLELLFRDFTAFVAFCGSKQGFMPTLPPLTRCNKDSRFLKLWKKASPCRVAGEDSPKSESINGIHSRASTSRGTQRLYIRLNTLHYVLSQLHILDKMLSLAPRQTPSPLNRHSNKRRHLAPTLSYFDLARSSIQAACQHVSEVAAYRLIFVDSNYVFYDGFYVGDVANSRIRPALRILKQNLSLLAAILTDRAQPLAVKEVMKAIFEAFLMVLLAGGTTRMFTISDSEMIEDDFKSLKCIFCTYGEGLVSEEVVEKEADILEGIIGLMGQSTEQLIEDFRILACESSGLGAVGEGQKVPMPPTTGRWHRADPNTILRVLCYRNDSIANRFLKTTFQLAKRR
ncbi:unc-13-like protein [Thalictrum thalictroides]|uniref:Unc-13-like protein n=1 Tax=Thalictrum thalictroides TaxID=46969 RepID=A0A7J6WXU7_THATH|nr:unc-13-like protein [Thalictrum thalictroides]